MEILVTFLLGLEVVSVSIAYLSKKFLELKLLKKLLDSGKKHLDDEGLFSRLIIDLGTDLFIPFLNLFEVGYLALNFEEKANAYLEDIDDEIYELLPLEKKVYEEDPSYLTVLKFNKKLYKALKGQPLSRMTNIQNGSVTYFKRLEDGDVEVLYSQGKDAKMGAHALRNKILGESEVINHAISEKYDSVEDFIRDAKEGTIDLSEKEDVSDAQNDMDYLQSLRESLLESKIQDDEESDAAPVSSRGRTLKMKDNKKNR